VGGDLAVVRFQGEVPGIQEMDLRVRHIASKGFRTARQEERIVLTPASTGGRCARSYSWNFG
jgi:hypothetical protein